MDNVYIEKVKGREDVRSITIVARNGVYYSVERVEQNEWVTTWSELVKSGPDKAHRVGGFAFKQAAARQEHELNEAAKHAAA